MRKKISVIMINTRSIKEHKAKEKPMEEPSVTAKKIDLETPDQSVDGVESKTTESTPMPKVEEQGKKKIEFVLLGNADETTNNTPATIKDDSQTKRTSIAESIAARVGTKPKEKEAVILTTEKGKTFGTVSAITTEAKQNEEQVTHGANQKSNFT